jgi:hypothetical protein
MGTIRFCGPISGCRDRGKMPCDFAYFVMPMKATRLARSCRGYLLMRRSALETAILRERAGAPIAATWSRRVSGSVERVSGSRYANRFGLTRRSIHG